MEHIIKSLAPIALLVAGAVVFVLGTAFLLASDATLASSSGASSDLAQAGRWLQFLAAACAMAAVCAAGWKVIVRSELVASAELGAAALGTLLVTIGLLASAATNGSSPAAPVTGAVGIGVWALLVLSRAARTSLTEHAPAEGPGRQADLWLTAAIGLFVLAIGYGFTSAASSRGAGIAAGVLEAIGIAVLGWAVITARSRRMLNSRPVPGVLAGLALLTLSFLAAAIVAGLALGTLAALATALTVVTAIELAAFAGLGVAAWLQVRAVYR